MSRGRNATNGMLGGGREGSPRALLDARLAIFIFIFIFRLRAKSSSTGNNSLAAVSRNS
jgi:hypothetical protein